MDYQNIGEELYADLGGAYCRSGFVVRKDELPEQLVEPEVVAVDYALPYPGQYIPQDCITVEQTRIS